MDPKDASRQFIVENLKWAGCHFGLGIQDVSDALRLGNTLPCDRRHCSCHVPGGPGEGRLDVVTIGFPCSPFSLQRPSRHQSGRPDLSFCHECSHGHTCCACLSTRFLSSLFVSCQRHSHQRKCKNQDVTHSGHPSGPKPFCILGVGGASQCKRRSSSHVSLLCLPTMCLAVGAGTLWWRRCGRPWPS